MSQTDGPVKEFDVDPAYDSGPTELTDDRFLDREMSWLAFNLRVLELAEATDVPLLERVKFLAIFSSNLDEFFMVRAAGLKRRIAAGVAVRNASGRLPREVLADIHSTSRGLMERQAAVWRDDVLPRLVAEGIDILHWDELDSAAQQRMSDLYADQVFPVLTPLAVDPSHPFPYISGLSLNLAVVVRNPRTRGEHFARVKVPQVLPRFIEVTEGLFVPLEDVIAAHLDSLFPGMEVVEHHTFRVTRNEDLEVEEDDAENLLVALEKELLRRKFGPPVRLEVEDSMNDHVLQLLINELGVSSSEVIRLPGPLDLSGLMAITDLDRAELKYPAFVPLTHANLAEHETASPADMFTAIRNRDVLLHHPYDSFSTTVHRFIEQAAADPKVLAIKMTLYRTAADGPLIDALIDAAEAGKQVLVLVEIKARFDEQANIGWARKLEEAGCHVVYGLVGLKTHCKLTLVVRQEPGGLVRYAHVGTGNYHHATARLYEDLGLLTSDRVMTEDVSRLFNQLSGYSAISDYRRLLVAPDFIRTGLVDRMRREIEHHRAGRPARIRIKVNSLVDEAICDGLYQASNAGVPVQLWVRGICALRPGVPGLSENIDARSVLGRFLEHSRIFWFENGGQPEVGIGSADMMHRNLDRRVEVLALVRSADHVATLGRLFDLCFDDETASWRLGADGVWTAHRHRADGRPKQDVQATLIARGRDRANSTLPLPRVRDPRSSEA